MQVAQHLVKSVSTGSLGNQVLCALNIALLKSNQAEVCICFGQHTTNARSLLQPVGSLAVVTLGIFDEGNIVEGTCIVRIDFCSLLISILGIVEVITIECSGIEQLLDAELTGIALQLILDLLVIAADNVVVDGHASATQLRQNAVGQLAESAADILNLLLTLLRILIHREHTQNDILVLDVRGTHQLLETFPVLGSIFRLKGSIGLCLLHLTLDIISGHVFTLASQTFVDVVATIG